jgi:pyruvate dehydrogenase E1 component beta subunit
VGAPFSPVPFAPNLEKEYIPNAAKIAEGVRRVLGKQV